MGQAGREMAPGTEQAEDASSEESPGAGGPPGARAPSWHGKAESGGDAGGDETQAQRAKGVAGWAGTPAQQRGVENSSETGTPKTKPGPAEAGEGNQRPQGPTRQRDPEARPPSWARPACSMPQSQGLRTGKQTCPRARGGVCLSVCPFPLSLHPPPPLMPKPMVAISAQGNLGEDKLKVFWVF